MNFVLSLDTPLFTVAWSPWQSLKEDLAGDTLFEIIAERKTRNSWNTFRYLSLRVPGHIEHSIEHQPAEALREIEHARATVCSRSESYAPKFVPVSGLV